MEVSQENSDVDRCNYVRPNAFNGRDLQSWWNKRPHVFVSELITLVRFLSLHCILLPTFLQVKCKTELLDSIYIYIYILFYMYIYIHTHMDYIYSISIECTASWLGFHSIFFKKSTRLADLGHWQSVHSGGRSVFVAHSVSRGSLPLGRIPHTQKERLPENKLLGLGVWGMLLGVCWKMLR